MDALDSIPWPGTESIPLPDGSPGSKNSDNKHKKLKRLASSVGDSTSSKSVPSKVVRVETAEEKERRKVEAKKAIAKSLSKYAEQNNSKPKVSETPTKTSTTSDLKRKLLQQESGIDVKIEQTVVDEMFKDFLASKMQQIESEYQQGDSSTKSNQVCGVDSVEKMNLLLDAELNDISSHKSKHKKKHKSKESSSKKHKESSSRRKKSSSSSEKYSSSYSDNLKESGCSNRTESSSSSRRDSSSYSSISSHKENSAKSDTTHSLNGLSPETDQDKIKNAKTTKNEVHIASKQDSKILNDATIVEKLDNSQSEKKSDTTVLTLSELKRPDHLKVKDPYSEDVDSFEITIPNVEKKIEKKAPLIKMQLALKITDTSASLISSGQDIETVKQKNLEDGEVASSNSEESDNDNDNSDDEDDDNNDDASETGSLSGSDKDSKKKKKKKKKKSKKHKLKKKKKKHKSSKDEDRKSDYKRKHRSYSRSRSRSRERKKSDSPKKWEDKGFDAYAYKPESIREKESERKRDYYHRDRSRSRDRDRSRRSRSRSRGRSRRSTSKDRDRKVKSNGNSDLRVRINKSKLREIAIKNALAMAKSGQGPSVDVTTLKAGGKSVGELTDFCKRISSKDNKEYELSTTESDSSSDDDDETWHHPFNVNEKAPIVMNIRNAKTLPLMSTVEKIAAGSTLRLQFPVSSGSTHRVKESEWVPVEKTSTPTTSVTGTKPAITAPALVAYPTPAAIAAAGAAPSTPVSMSTPASVAMEVAHSSIVSKLEPPTASLKTCPPPAPVKSEDKVFQDPPAANVDISSIISDRLKAVRQLQDNPYDYKAMSSIAESQKKASMWASSKHLPGKFIGSTGVQILSQDELMGPDKRRQAWIKKDQFTKLAPVGPGIGMALLERMGWKRGTGLGKNNEGSVEPLMLDVKTDRKGLKAVEETKGGNRMSRFGMAGGGKGGRGGPPGGASSATKLPKDLSGKHPVSALVEFCNRRKWGSPEFELVHESGPDHKKNFLFKVLVNKTYYQPSVASNNKKLAKASAAAACLMELGLLPRE